VPHAEDDEHVPEGLVPAAPPEIHNQHGYTQVVEGRRPLPGRPSKDEAADERCDVVVHVHAGVHQHAVALCK